MDRRNYSASHADILENPNIKAVQYPSCRDPKNRPNFAILEIASLDKQIDEERVMSFYFDPPQRLIRWLEDGRILDITWKTVS
ncbi:MAG: hypothetical protein ACYCPQ_04880 [Elusimicrobiota bacterium]